MGLGPAASERLIDTAKNKYKWGGAGREARGFQPPSGEGGVYVWCLLAPVWSLNAARQGLP